MEAKGPLPRAGLGRPAHQGSCRALWHAPMGRGGAHSERPSGSYGSLLGSPPRLRRGDRMKCAHGLWPRGGAGAQPPRHQGRSCGAGPATGRQWFPGVLIATQSLTDMLLPESSSSWEVATPSFQGLRLQTSDSPLAPFSPSPPHLSPPTC